MTPGEQSEYYASCNLLTILRVMLLTLLIIHIGALVTVYEIYLY